MVHAKIFFVTGVSLPSRGISDSIRVNCDSSAVASVGRQWMSSTTRIVGRRLLKRARVLATELTVGAIGSCKKPSNPGLTLIASATRFATDNNVSW